MAKLGLSSVDDLNSDRNFQRLEAVAEKSLDVDSGISSVTGTLIVPTKLLRVDRVVAGFDVLVAAGACFIVAYVGPTIKDITIKVYSNTFAESTISSDISWIATGELGLG